MTPINGQRGAALVIVLMVVALVATLAVSMGGRLQLQIIRTQNLQEAEQAYWYMQSAEQLVALVLREEISADSDVVHLNQQWATQAGTFPVSGGFIQGRIKDLRSCMNVNALDSAGQSANALERRKAQFKALFIAREIDDYTADVMVDSLVDWIDEDTQISGTYGAEDPDYESLPTPYRAGNTPLLHHSELRLVRGFTRDSYQKVKDYLCVIPGASDGRININTIALEQPEILYAMFAGRLDLNDAVNFLANRPENGFADVSEFSQDPMLVAAAQAPNTQAPNTNTNTGSENTGNDDDDNPTGGEQTSGQDVFSDFTVTSSYFELRGAVRYGDLIQSGTSQIRLDGNQATILYRGTGR